MTNLMKGGFHDHIHCLLLLLIYIYGGGGGRGGGACPKDNLSYSVICDQFTVFMIMEFIFF
jgi:hypothetical protein